MPREPSAVKTISTAWGRTSPRLSVVVPAQKLLDDLDKRNYALAGHDCVKAVATFEVTSSKPRAAFTICSSA